MKMRFCVYASAFLAVLICVAALIFLHFWLGIAICIAAAAAWAVFFVRFLLLRYEISESEIKITGGIFFKYKRTVKRAAILSRSRIYAGRRLICTVIRTAGSKIILFCELPEY